MKQVVFYVTIVSMFMFSGCAMQKGKPVVPKQAKNVIVMVGDGMGIGQIEIARLLEKGKKGRLFLQTLPNVGLVQTFSSDNFVPDSAAAGTSLATGIKTINKRVGMTSEGLGVDSIADLFKKDGKSVGLISTNTVVDATPASFGASVASRSEQAEIARQLLSNGFDVILGGGAKYFGEKKQKGPDLIPQFKEKGYVIVKDKNELAAAGSPEKLLGLFTSSYMNYVQDLEEKNSLEPSILEMTKTAIGSLAKNKKGFFLMSEGARIDHAAHAVDVTSVWRETIEFDKAVEYAVNWAKKDGNTLVVVVADHETMGLAAAEPMDIEALKSIEVSAEYIAYQFEKNADKSAFTIDSIQAAFKKYAKFEVSAEEAAALNERSKNNKGGLAYEYKIGWEIGSIIADHYGVGAMSSSIRARSKTGGHSGNMIPIFVFGPGASTFEGVMDNTDVFKKIKMVAKY